MHCAKLFEICTHAETNIFNALDRSTYQQIRKVCIAAILHTDIAHHFDMVKEIGLVYELTSKYCDAQAADPMNLIPDFENEVLRKNQMLFYKLFLHLADVSNPLKPFDTCLEWATRVLDEFFLQGDEEKRLGLPVGMLNDREKVNRPGSQHGFINFIVSPLVVVAVRVFQPLQPCLQQLAENIEQWKRLWQQDVGPTEDELAGREADVAKLTDLANKLGERCVLPETGVAGVAVKLNRQVTRLSTSSVLSRSYLSQVQQKWKTRTSDLASGSGSGSRSSSKSMGARPSHENVGVSKSFDSS
jgi:cAMP-specific phosphodiesterase 4